MMNVWRILSYLLSFNDAYCKMPSFPVSLFRMIAQLSAPMMQKILGSKRLKRYSYWAAPLKSIRQFDNILEYRKFFIADNVEKETRNNCSNRKEDSTANRKSQNHRSVLCYLICDR